MGYFYLAVAILCGCTKGYCGKKTSGAVKETKDAMLANILRMIFCVVIGFAILAFGGNINLLNAGFNTLLISFLSGVGMSAFVVVWLLTVKRGAYMTLDVFLMLGVIIPIAASTILFNEGIRLNQIIGFIVLTLASVIMCSYNNSIKEKMSISSLVLLILCGVSNGVVSLSQKLFVNYVKDGSNVVFNFYTYAFSAVILTVCYFAFGKKEKQKSENIFTAQKTLICYIAVMAVCLFLNTFFMTKSASVLPSVILYPLSQGGSLILSSLMSAVFFKEKITKVCVVGLVVAFAGLIVMNML